MSEIDVRTTMGLLRGTESAGIATFKGIPYAAPPVGARRWRAPEPPDSWRGTRDATQFGRSAIQHWHTGPIGELIGMAAGPMDEDCLYLNVWTPACDNRRRPVMVWIHGGGHVVGSGSQPRMHGDRLARRGDVVVVTINYRLGALGFLYAPQLGASGNEALLDQVAALRWVRNEIAAFGGDPENVTVFGQSAGGSHIAKLMTMRAAEGCFDKAIPMSGSLLPQVPADDAARLAEQLANRFGGFDALRDVPAKEILPVQVELTREGEIPAGKMRFGPVCDGRVIAEDAATVIGRGDYTTGMPLLVGNTRDEYGLWTGNDPSMPSLNEGGLEQRASALFGSRAAEAIKIYRAVRLHRGADVSRAAIWRAMMTDSMFNMPAIRMAEMHARHTPAVWMYRFDYGSPAMEGRLGACHSLDVPFVFGTLDQEDRARVCGAGPAVTALSARVMDTYVAFARTGVPTHADLDWPRYEPTNRATMIFDLSPRLEKAPAEEERAFWASLAT